MRGPLPLSDSDFAAIRASVLAKIERRRPYGWYLALAASVVVAVLSIVMVRQPAMAPAPSGVRASRPHPATVSVAGIAAPPTKKQQHETRLRPRRHTRTPNAQLARIEIHTADPDVRIIWITN